MSQSVLEWYISYSSLNVIQHSVYLNLKKNKPYLLETWTWIGIDIGSIELFNDYQFRPKEINTITNLIQTLNLPLKLYINGVSTNVKEDSIVLSKSNHTQLKWYYDPFRKESHYKNRIELILKENKLNNNQLAKKSALDKAQITLYLNSKTIPSIKSIKAMSKAINKPYPSFFGGNETDNFSIINRLLEFQSELNLSDISFRNMIGITKYIWEQYLIGSRELSTKTLATILNRIMISHEEFFSNVTFSSLLSDNKTTYLLSKKRPV